MADRAGIIVGAVSAIIIFFSLFFSGIYLLSDPMLREAVTFSVVAQYVSLAYPLPYSQNRALGSAEDALLEHLDPFSYRLNRRDYSDLLEEAGGEYGGIGITVVPRDTTIMVVSVREGGPATVAGMKSGDYIIAIGGSPIPKDDPASAIDMIRGLSGSAVKVTVYRSSLSDTLLLEVTRGEIRLEHIPYAGLTADSIAYIRIDDFEAGLTDDLESIVDSLEKLNPRGYIIDLEGNPGGFLEEAIDAADLFLPDGALILGVASRSRWDSRTYKASGDPVTDRPIVILTDRGTASAAEILSGAMRGAGRAVASGDTTFGKGLVQTLYDLPDQEAFKLTTARYFFADGRFLNPPDTALTFQGLPPDLIYRPSGEPAFREIILSGFLVYDFVETHWEHLKSHPDHFALPDSMLSLFREFAQSRGFTYQSRLTETIAETIMEQRLNGAPADRIAGLMGLERVSRAVDSGVFTREAKFLRYEIRRVLVEKKSGTKAMYREVIVPDREDIRLASELLLDRHRYDSLLRDSARAL